MIYLNEETFQARKVHACGQPCEESIYEIKGQEQIGRQEIYKQKRTEQNRTEQNIVRPWKGEAAAAVWGEMRCVVKWDSGVTLCTFLIKCIDAFDEK